MESLYVFPNTVGENISLQDFFVVILLDISKGDNRSPGNYIPIRFKEPLCHLVTIIFSRTKDLAKELGLVWGFSRSINSIGQFISLELTIVGYVSLLTKGSKVRILALYI